ncbi:hypothetical protein ACLI09_07490 [Flavobacterium sp. RHBU_24]|uniref:hypothetical protein n=1 Tax=Flavobacterium sp. RHBU_24 TaxID=3391185 RepID=UPI0039854898
MLTACVESHRWTETEREEFRLKCESTTTFVPESILFSGFSYNEIDIIKVVEREGTMAIDTFYIYTNKEIHGGDTLRNKLWADVDRPFALKNTYDFYLEKSKPYTLTDMEMVMWSQYTMFSEGYGCVMGNFTVDGKRFEQTGNIEFTKRGFTYNWE